MARRIAIGVGAVVAVAAVGGGAWAWQELAGGGTQPHDVLPADSVGYVRLDLDPGAAQKVDLFRLARRVPDLAKELGIEEDTDVRRLVVEDALGDCVDYEKDVEPWLGERLGAAFGPRAEEESVRIAVQVTDEDAARKGIAKLFACDDEEFGLAFLDGYAVVTPTQDSADATVEAATKKALGDDDRFVADMESLGEQGLASGWVDLEGVAALAEEADPDGEIGLAEAAEQATSAAIAVRAGSDTLEVAGVSRVDEDVETPDVRPLSALPEDTALALSVVGGGEQVEEQWEELVTQLDDVLGSGFLPLASSVPETATPTGPDEQSRLEGASPDGSVVEDVVAEVERTLDVRLPEDLGTLLGDALTLWVGTEGLAELPTASGPEALGDLAVGLRMESDPAEATDLAERLAASLGELSGMPLVAEGTDDGAVLGLNEDAAAALAGDDGGLGSSDRFASVVEDGDGFAGGFFLDVTAVLAALREADPPPDVEDVLDQVGVVEAVGVSSSRREADLVDVRLRVAFAEAD